MGNDLRTYSHVLSLALEPWAMTRPMVATIAHVLAHHLAGRPLDLSTLERHEPVALQVMPAPTAAPAQGVAIVPVHGVIAPRMSAFTDISGGATFEQAKQDVRKALAHAGVGTIVLDLDSCGGSVLGASEFAHFLLQAREQKPIIAAGNFTMASAAYWIGACASEVVWAPSAMGGSIGVYSIHEDLTEMLAELGVKLTYISAGKWKVDGIDGGALTETGAARLKAHVDAHYTRFITDVAAGRKVTADAVRNGFGEGAVVNADDALALGMIDRIETLDETLARIAATAPSPTATAIGAVDPPASLPAATSQEPAQATDQERARVCRELETAFLGLGL